ncbi:SUMO-activating enzyme subunit 1B-1 [Capsicum baccatum]|uniref:Ubiquitin-like 1-activating enzyme E1A n=1 Tax=Capsicum baccatum TaxID=33114 RepID=A0A2G2X8R8_CAPBA|nr:SUMO-activating enzyme subunit 1B-1 [Capsicum baccatum]
MTMSANIIPKPKHDYDQNLGLKMLLLCLEEEEEIANHVITRCQILIPMFLRLEMGTEVEQLTEQETAIYDRQIRVWGVDAQRRLSKSHVFVSGLNGTAVEFCKNIVLAGVGSLTLNDDRLVTEDLLYANFLIPPDENDFRGKSVAELCCDSLKDFNPMVSVSVEKGALSIFDADFFQKFDVVVVSCCSLLTKKSVNSICHKLPKRVAFYSVECRDSCGEIFVDLKNYSYCKKKNDETIECELRYPSFEEAIAVPWKSLPKRLSKLYYAMRVIERFEALERRNPGETSVDDLPNVLNLRKEICEAHCLNESQIPDSLLRRLIASRTEFPPVCAIVGGILGQEVIKAISGKGDPLKNFFFFDAMDGKGIIEDISNVSS